jgi:hydrogenase maturation protein HypF
MPGLFITIQGTVQGVGFRPFVYRCARDHDITGRVYNDARGAAIEAFGSREKLNLFLGAIQASPPPLAVIRRIDVKELGSEPPSRFIIDESHAGDVLAVDVARDTGVCDACLREMRDPGNRRHHHPFINCTDCGPRYTIIKQLPYDRPFTTMSGFAMCNECSREYEDPLNRRFHAQPVCCPKCGPKLTLCDSAGRPMEEPDPIAACIALLSAGSIVAIKGIGGFHLACRADRSDAVARLRERKHRDEKPLAIMVPDSAAAARVALISKPERALLESIERPIVIVEKRSDVQNIAPEVAPRVPTLGIMLPYAPLHHLLFENAPYGALVMTSGNRTDEPISATNQEALEKLGGIADAFLIHDREIYIRNDDSIVRALGSAPVIMRRARGYVPEPLPAGGPVDGIVALGGILKGTVTVGRGAVCYTSQYLGSVDKIEIIDHLDRMMRHLLSLLGVSPLRYVCDLHPAGLTRKLAERTGLPVDYVQHHHAHAVACMAENRFEGPALAVVYDGTGYGEDGTIWGGEILQVDRAHYTRLGHLAPLPLPGGDMAVVNPGRMAVAALYGTMGERSLDACRWMPEPERRAVIDMIKTSTNCPLTSSMGRLFDACAAILGICEKRTYEGQPAIELEGCAERNVHHGYEPPVHDQDGRIIIDGAAILREAWLDFCRGTSPARVSGRFHATIADATIEAAVRASKTTGLKTVCLSGGCFQNALLFGLVVNGFAGAGLQVLTHHLLPPNDECVSFGQAIVAGARGKHGNR